MFNAITLEVNHKPFNKTDEGQKPMIQKSGSFKDLFPELLVDWNYEKNTISPSEIASKSNKKVYWKCHTCGTEWIASINNRISHGTGCPGCSGRAVVKGKNDIFSVKPYLKDTWDFDKNKDIDPYHELCNSKKNAYWKCPLCEKSFFKPIYVVARGKKYCDSCQNQFQTSFPEQAIFYYIHQAFFDAKNRYSDLGFEIDIFIPSLSVAIEYDGVNWHSGNKSIAKDNDKNEICFEHNINLFRFREEGLPELNNKCIILNVKSNDDNSLQDSIIELFGILKRDIDCNINRDYTAILRSFRKMKRESSLTVI